MKSHILTFLLFALCAFTWSKVPQRNILHDSGSCYLWYDNMYSQDTILLAFLHEYRTQDLYIPRIPTSHEIVFDIKLKTKVSEIVFRQLLNYGSVTESIRESTKQTKIREFIKKKTCYYCGRVKINKKFDSYLFLIQDSSQDHAVDDESDEVEECVDDKMILVNLYNDTITSVSLILSYFSFDGCVFYSYIGSCRHNEYLFYSESVSCCVVPNEKSKDEIRFKFTDIGQFVLLPLKR